jgi:hypothetical protein
MPGSSSGAPPKLSKRPHSERKEVIYVLRKLALLTAVAALGLALAGSASAKKNPPNGNAYGHYVGFVDGR